MENKNNRMMEVINRSGSTVVYSIPEDNVRREFTPHEKKRISYAELEKLISRPGGMTLITNYLLIQDIEAVKDLEVPAEPEYFMSEQDVIKLLQEGSIEAFLDALDFAPEGVLELIKDYAVKLPVNDVAKRDAILKKTGFNVTLAIQHNAESKEASEENINAPKRRVITEAQPQTARRTAPEYKVITSE
jgi:hypothetical protein